MTCLEKTKRSPNALHNSRYNFQQIHSYGGSTIEFKVVLHHQDWINSEILSSVTLSNLLLDLLFILLLNFNLAQHFKCKFHPFHEKNSNVFIAEHYAPVNIIKWKQKTIGKIGELVFIQLVQC